MFATTVALLNVTYRGKDRGFAFGVWGAVNGAAAAAGPIVGGLLTEHFGWRWIFLVNLPVSLLAVWFTVRGVTESQGRTDARVRPARHRRVHAQRGRGHVTPSSAAARPAGPRRRPWPRSRISAVALLVFVLVERATDHPMLDLRLFRSGSFSTLMVAALLVQAAAFAYLPFVTVWLQPFLGKGPVDAGLLGALPMSVASFVVAAFVGRLLHGRAPVDDRAGAAARRRRRPAAGPADRDQPRHGAHPGPDRGRCRRGLVLPVLASAALAAAPPERSGMASGAVNTFRQLGFALGVAVFGAVFSHRLAAHRDPRAGVADGARPDAARRRTGRLGGRCTGAAVRPPSGRSPPGGVRRGSGAGPARPSRFWQPLTRG